MQTNGREYRVAEEIFQQFPGYVRGVVLACGVTNDRTVDAVRTLLREAEAGVRERLQDNAVADHPRIKSWRDAFRAFGARPADFRSSVEAMVRRVVRNEELPSISTLVDLGNVISLRHLLPAGSHAIDELNGDLELRRADGTEVFTPFGSTETEHPEPGEVVFAEGNIVLTRRWVWRQAIHTLTVPDTRAVEFNLDGLPPVSIVEVRQACDELATLVQTYCGGETKCFLLTADSPSLQLAL